MSVQLITDAARLFALRDEWTDLLRDSDADGLFLTWEWLSTWWKHVAGGRQLALLGVWEGRDLVGLAPLARRPGQAAGLATASLEFLGSGTVGSDYLDVIVRRGRERGALDELAEALEAGRVRLDLAQVPAGGSAARGLADRLGGRGWLVVERRTHTCPFIRLAGHTWPSLLASLGASHRANVRRRFRQAAARGATLSVVTTPGERRRAFDILRQLHGLRWGQRTEALPSPALVAFHDEMTAVALERGWLRLSVLSVDGRPVAALYGFRYGPRYAFYQAGFDPARGQESPGLVLLGRSIEAALAESAAEYDLLHGDERYKSLWAREARGLVRLEISPRTVRDSVYATARAARHVAGRAARRVLPAPVTAWLGAAAQRARAEFA